MACHCPPIGVEFMPVPEPVFQFAPRGGVRIGFVLLGSFRHSGREFNGFHLVELGVGKISRHRRFSGGFSNHVSILHYRPDLSNDLNRFFSLRLFVACPIILENSIGLSNAQLEDNGTARKFCHFGRSAIFGLAHHLLLPFWQM